MIITPSHSPQIYDVSLMINNPIRITYHPLQNSPNFIYSELKNVDVTFQTP